MNNNKSFIKPENYVQIQGWMISELGLKGNELLIFAIIYGFSQDEVNKFSGSLQYLADWTNSTKQGVLKNLKSLVDKNIISKEENINNGVKICSYYVTKFNGGIKQSLMGGIKQSLPNNIEYNKLDNKKEIYKESFEEFWKEYPKQRAGAKDKAYKSYCKAISEKKITVEKLLEVVKRYAISDDVRKGYAKGCAAWLNDERFNDEKLNPFVGVRDGWFYCSDGSRVEL